MTDQTTDAKSDDLMTEARERFKRCQEADEENRRGAEEAIKFMALEQWPEELKRKREQQGRPCLVVDKITQHIRQVMNDQRQNRPAIKVRPVDDKSDPEVAEMYQGLIRNIEDQSGADIAYDTAFEHAIVTGQGFWRILTDYSDDNSFEQDIRVMRIPNRFTVYLDPDHQSPDGSDAKYAFVVEEMGKDDYKSQYGDCQIDWDADSDKYGDWIEKEKVRVAEYFRIEQEDAEIHMLADGTVHNGPLPEGAQAIKSRSLKVNKVKWSKLNGKEEIDSGEWIGKYIPIVEVVGNELWKDGKRELTGMVEPAMDAMRMHNYAASAFVEMVALAPKAPYIAAEGQIEGHEKEWADANSDNVAVLPYKPATVDGHPVPPPIRQPMQGIPSGWDKIMMNTEHDIQGALGRYQASLGAPSNEKSGRAIMARQREGDVATFHYIDNLSRSIRHTGRIIIDLIPKIYDTKRIARVLGEDGSTDAVMLNPDLQGQKDEWRDEMGRKVGMMFNPTVGKYDVSVSVGPSYTTKRQESVEAQMQLVQANPAVFPIIGDIMIRNMDWPGADDIADRLKAMLPPQIQQLEQENGPPNPQMMAMMAQIEQAQMKMQEREAMIQQAEAELQKRAQEVGANQNEIATETMRLQTERKALESERKVFSAEVRAKLLEIENSEMKAVNKINSTMQDAQPQPDAGNVGNDTVRTVAMVKEVLRNDDAQRQAEMDELRSHVSSIGQALQSLAQTVQASLPSPEIDVAYGSDGRIASVNGRPVNRRPMVN